MKLFFPAAIAFFLLSFQQDISPSVRLFEEGIILEYNFSQYITEKPLNNSRVVNSYSDLEETDDGYSVTETSNYYFGGGDHLKTTTYIRLENDTLYTSYNPSDNLMDYTEYPLNYRVGLELRSIATDVLVNDVKQTFINKNRKIVGEELVKTEAGEFECYKITGESGYDSKVYAYTMWFNPEIGIVKTEYYKKKGKRFMSTVLKKITVK